MISTYAELQAVVADWLNREDLAALIPSFIRLAEGDIYLDLQCPDNEFIATYTSSTWNINGVSPVVVSDGIAHNLPANFMAFRQVRWNGRPLDSVSDLQLFARLYAGSDTQPSAFCVTNRKIAFSSDIPTDPATWAATDSLVYAYYGVESLDSYPTWQVGANPVDNPAVPDLVPQVLTQAGGNTTRMLQRNPDIYLHGSLFHGSLYLKDDQGIATWGALFRAGLSDLKTASKRSRYAGGTKSVGSAY